MVITKNLSPLSATNFFLCVLFTFSDEHFFYLAFENSVCQNYVTEKFWNIKRLIVPIVLSRKIFANLCIPEGAFIAADDFGSIKELTEYLKKVAADLQLYKR